MMRSTLKRIGEYFEVHSMKETPCFVYEILRLAWF